jgi:hypothetical protein
MLGIVLRNIICPAPDRYLMQRSRARLKTIAGVAAALVMLSGTAVPALSGARGGADSLMLFGGQASETNFMDIMVKPWTIDMNNIGVVGASYSHRFGTVSDLVGDVLPAHIGDYLTVEAEGGTSFRFGDEDLGEAWGALYLRYDNLPWNDTVYTTIGVDTGLSLLTDISEFEKGRDSEHRSSKLLHYLGPEITFADPDNKNVELVFRLHHRSGVFGLFDDVVSGSTFLSTGIRIRF